MKTKESEEKSISHVRVGVGVLVKDPTNPQKVTTCIVSFSVQ